MPGYFNIDEAVKHVKTIADNNRCVTCDKLSGVRMRFSCGHTICEECMNVANECLTCIHSKNSEAVTDVPQIQRAENAFNLLTAFQDTHNIDVYRRYRLSEKLRLEKELFPECIQATFKYYNKRRSSQISSIEDKENQRSSYFAGDEIRNFVPITMNTRINLVQKWLEKNENVTSPLRKPFSDITINSPFTVKQNGLFIKSKGVILDNSKNSLNRKLKKRMNVKKDKSKYRKSIKETLSSSLLKPNDIPKTLDNSKLENKSAKILQNKKFKNNTVVNYNISENCTANDNVDAIVIENTQSQVVDKDKIAWFAVLQADEKDSINELDGNEVSRSVTRNEKEVSKQINNRKNVCFYKKGFLFTSCLCLHNYSNYLKNQRLNTNDVSITINTDNILTSITFSKNDHNYMKVVSKHSFATQTDETFCNDIIEVNSDKSLPDQIILQEQDLNIRSQNLFINSGKIYDINGKSDVEDENIRNHINSANRSSDVHYLVINDSDSDHDMNCSGKLEVTADVHRSSDIHCGVLSAVEQADYQSRVRREGRRRTIDSNNSSEKENVEPNRVKKPRLGKKEDMKK